MSDEMEREGDEMEREDRLTLEGYLRIMPSLGEQQLLAISAAHRGIEDERLEQARASAGEIARGENLLEELQALHFTIAQWIGSRYSTSRRYTGEGLADPPVLLDIREQARPALLDAATALFLVERLAPDAFDALVEAVDSVIG